MSLIKTKYIVDDLLVPVLQAVYMHAFDDETREKILHNEFTPDDSVRPLEAIAQGGEERRGKMLDYLTGHDDEKSIEIFDGHYSLNINNNALLKTLKPEEVSEVQQLLISSVEGFFNDFAEGKSYSGRNVYNTLRVLSKDQDLRLGLFRTYGNPLIQEISDYLKKSRGQDVNFAVKKSLDKDGKEVEEVKLVEKANKEEKKAEKSSDEEADKIKEALKQMYMSEHGFSEELASKLAEENFSKYHLDITSVDGKAVMVLYGDSDYFELSDDQASQVKIDSTDSLASELKQRLIKSIEIKAKTAYLKLGLSEKEAQKKAEIFANNDGYDRQRDENGKMHYYYLKYDEQTGEMTKIEISSQDWNQIAYVGKNFMLENNKEWMSDFDAEDFQHESRESRFAEVPETKDQVADDVVDNSAQPEVQEQVKPVIADQLLLSHEQLPQDDVVQDMNENKTPVLPDPHLPYLDTQKPVLPDLSVKKEESEQNDLSGLNILTQGQEPYSPVRSFMPNTRLSAMMADGIITEAMLEQIDKENATRQTISTNMIPKQVVTTVRKISKNPRRITDNQLMTSRAKTNFRGGQTTNRVKQNNLGSLSTDYGDGMEEELSGGASAKTSRSEQTTNKKAKSSLAKKAGYWLLASATGGGGLVTVGSATGII